MTLPEYKVCPLCNINKHHSDYHLRKDKGYTYLKSYCKSCSNKKSKTSQYNTCVCGFSKKKKSELCQKCSIKSRTVFNTVKDITHYTSYGPQCKYNIIRLRARSIMKDHPIKCQSCGYDKHVEIAHIKPISSFSEDALIDDINHKDNLIMLCPNCHWEFDNGYLSIENQVGLSGHDPASPV